MDIRRRNPPRWGTAAFLLKAEITQQAIGLPTTQAIGGFSDADVTALPLNYLR